MDRIGTIADEAFSLLGARRQISPFSSRYPGFALAEAYQVAARVRSIRGTRGEKGIGRKIGFTNTAIWSGYGITGPIWNYMFDTTVHDLCDARSPVQLDSFTEPRIEPEIALGLGRAPEQGMTEDELLGCLDWAAHGFEIVHSIFPGWRFTAADAVAGYGLHGALLLGERYTVDRDVNRWREMLSSFSVEIVCSDGRRATGYARNVLGGPIKALRFLVEELARSPECEPLAAGEIVTTGTLTEAMPITPGDTWTTQFADSSIDGIRVTFG